MAWPPTGTGLMPDGKHPPKPGCWVVGESSDGIRFSFVRSICDDVGINMNALLLDDDGKGVYL